MERKKETYSKNLEKRRLKKWKNLTKSNSTSSNNIKEVELNKTKNVIRNNTPSHKVKLITDNCVSRRKKKKTYMEVVESGSSNINERITCVRIAP